MKLIKIGWNFLFYKFPVPEGYRKSVTPSAHQPPFWRSHSRYLGATSGLSLAAAVSTRSGPHVRRMRAAVWTAVCAARTALVPLLI